MKSRRLQFHYTLRDADGRMLDTSRGGPPLACEEGAGEIVEGLEAALREMRLGERRQVAVRPELGYGLRDEALVQRVPRERLPVAEVRPGDQFQTGPDRHAPIVTVVAVEGSDVVLDANHPLAGQVLHFDVELVAADVTPGA
jgi:FKBP-type peptidyl-prolyl cis-trans isomerase SlyD